MSTNRRNLINFYVNFNFEVIRCYFLFIHFTLYIGLNAISGYHSAVIINHNTEKYPRIKT